MNNIQKRFLLFLFGCTGVRHLFVIVAKNSSIIGLQYLGYLALLPMLGFIYIYTTDSRKSGMETFGEKIWWNDLRPVHALLYGLFAYNALIGNKNAWIYLLIDVTIGLFSFMIFHYLNGDFAHLLT